MTFHLTPTAKGPIAVAEPTATDVIDGVGAFLDVVMSAPSSTLALPRSAVAPRFFDLSSGLAGEILQKVSNYQRRLILLGDFSEVTRTSLRDFIRESNRTGKVLFVDSVETAIGLLK